MKSDDLDLESGKLGYIGGKVGLCLKSNELGVLVRSFPKFWYSDRWFFHHFSACIFIEFVNNVYIEIALILVVGYSELQEGYVTLPIGNVGIPQETIT